MRTTQWKMLRDWILVIRICSWNHWFQSDLHDMCTSAIMFEEIYQICQLFNWRNWIQCTNTRTIHGPYQCALCIADITRSFVILFLVRASEVGLPLYSSACVFRFWIWQYCQMVLKGNTSNRIFDDVIQLCSLHLQNATRRTKSSWKDSNQLV